MLSQGLKSEWAFSGVAEWQPRKFLDGVEKRILSPSQPAQLTAPSSEGAGVRGYIPGG